MKLKFQKNVFFVLVFFALLGFLNFEKKNHYSLISKNELFDIHKKLSLLKKEEIDDLTCFFHEATRFSEFIYTFADVKPMSIAIFLQESDDLPPILHEEYHRPKHRRYADAIERGYRTWEKYQDLFPLKKYLVIRFPAQHCKGVQHVALIHPQLCFKVIQENLTDFSEVLGKSCEADEIFEIVTHPNHENFHKILEHDRLLGILLGYGRNNAYLFEQKNFKKLKSFTNEWPIWPKKWLLPGFLCDPEMQETIELKRNFTRARKLIRWTYFFRNDLEVTLALLSRNHESKSSD